MNRTDGLKNIDFILLDLLSTVFSFVLAFVLRFGFKYNNSYFNVFCLIVIINIFCVYFYEPYKNILKDGYLIALKRTIAFDFLQMLILTFVLVMFKTNYLFSRLMLGYYYVLYFLLSYLLRIYRKRMLKKRAKAAIKKGLKNLLIITNSDNLGSLGQRIFENNRNMHRISGICVCDKDFKGKLINEVPVVCNADEVLSYVCHNWIDEVFFDMPYELIPHGLVSGFATAGISLHITLSKIKELDGQDQTIDTLFDETVLSSSVKARTNFQLFTKRLIDIIGSLFGCLITLLLMLIVGPLIVIKSPGPVFYRQERIGLNGKHFYMFKFRSMVKDADNLKKELLAQNRIKDGMMFKIEDDPRIIPGVGEFIRKTSIDEFPQFLNVLLGDMSLVGTRPPTIDEWEKYQLEHRVRMSIKPGITGLWQISGRSEITDFNKVVELDREYINRWSLILDIKIIFKTIIVLFSDRSGAM